MSTLNRPHTASMMQPVEGALAPAESDRSDLFQFTPRQLATLLAAARFYQHELAIAVLAVPIRFREIASAAGAPLTDAEIDELCAIVTPGDLACVDCGGEVSQ